MVRERVTEKSKGALAVAWCVFAVAIVSGILTIVVAGAVLSGHARITSHEQHSGAVTIDNPLIEKK